MSDHTINGKPTSIGHAVHYTASDGRKHIVSIKSLNGNNADLEGTVDGQLKQFTAVPHSTAGSPHSWDHAS